MAQAIHAYIVYRVVAVLGFGLGFGINKPICIPAYGYVCLCFESKILIHPGKVGNTQQRRKVHEAIAVWSLALLDHRIQRKTLSAGRGKRRAPPGGTQLRWVDLLSRDLAEIPHWQEPVQDGATWFYLCTKVRKSSCY